MLWLVNQLSEGHGLKVEETPSLEVHADAARGPLVPGAETFPGVEPFVEFFGGTEPIPLLEIEPGPAGDATEVMAGSLTAVEFVDFVPHVLRGDNTHRMYVANEFFEDWYADASDDELTLAKVKLSRRASALALDAVNRWFEMGLQDEDEFVHRDEMKRLEPGDDGTKWESHGLMMASRSEDLGGGLVHKMRTLLPWEEHQGVYNLQDEERWLLLELSRREASAD